MLGRSHRKLRPRIINRCFGYIPGRVWTPPANYETLDLATEYDQVLEDAILQNQGQLAAHFQLKGDPGSTKTKRAILFALRSLRNPLLYQQNAARFGPTEICSLKPYNGFLRALYNYPPDFKKIASAMDDLPQPVVNVVQSVHLKDLLAKTLAAEPAGLLSVMNRLEGGAFPFTAYEHAKILLALAKLKRCNPNTRQTLFSERFHAHKAIFEKTKERGVLNVLLEAAAHINSPEVDYFTRQKMVENGIHPDRATYMTLMKYEEDAAGTKRLFREFCDAGHVIDIQILTIMMQSFLQQGFVQAAETMLAQLTRSHATTHLAPANNSKLTDTLVMVDTVGSIVSGQKGSVHDAPMVPLVPNSGILAMFARHYLSTGDFDKLLQTLVQMANQGFHPRRDLFYSILDAFDRAEWTKSDFETTVHLIHDLHNHRPLITDSLANRLAASNEKYNIDMP